MRPQRLLTQGEIETEIVKLSDALEDATIRFANLAERSATVEADFKLAYYRSLLKAIGFGDRKMTVHEREAQAHTACAEAFRTRLIYEARVDAARIRELVAEEEVLAQVLGVFERKLRKDHDDEA